MMNFTKEQRAAITTEGNVVVSAAAGAGKTAVLTERVVTQVASGIPIDKMLILTFTRTAAAEMKHRIAKRLKTEAANCEDEQRRVYLLEQADSVGNASISTIHSFCQRVVTRHYHIAELSPQVRTMDETEAAALKAEVMDTLMTELATDSKESYRLLLESFGSESSLIQSLNKLFAFLQAQPDPEGWIRDAGENCDKYERFLHIRDVLLAGAKEDVSEACHQLERVRDELEPEYGKVISGIDTTLLAVRGALLQTDAEYYAQSINAVAFPRLTYPRGTEDFIKVPVKDARDELKRLILAQASLFVKDGGQLWQEQLELSPATKALTAAMLRFMELYSMEKREKAVMDFDDLEHHCLTILADSSVADEYRKRYRHIVVDEYQDSNRVQEAILTRVKREDNLFLVGDVKQSIYGFRMADPSLFLEKLSEYSGKRGTAIYLNDNFRSGDAVINAVNAAFMRLMNMDTCGMDYGTQRLVRGIEQPQGCAQLHIVEREGEDMLDAQAEATLCGNELIRLMNEELYTDVKGGEQRRYRYSDFAVLLRSTTNARLWAQTLSRMGIPCFAQLSGGYFDTIEVMLLMNLLSVIDNRRQDIPLLSVMRSCFGGFDDEELIELRTRVPKGDYLDCLLAAADSEGALGEHVRRFMGFLDYYRDAKTTRPVSELVAHILDNTDIYPVMGALAGGAQRKSNLDALVEKARDFDKGGGYSVHGFLNYMSQVNKNARMGESQTATADVVQLMSIHKSKGLEYPVIFLGGLGTNFNRRDLSEDLIPYSTLGLGLRCMDSCGVKHESATRKAICRELRRDMTAEELRVLYVAMTRARSRLWLVGSARKADEKLGSVTELTNSEIRGEANALKWLLFALNGQVPVYAHRKEELLAVPEAEPEAAFVSEKSLVEPLRLRLSWSYPFASETTLPNKTSVTELTERSQTEYDVPSFAAKGESATALGTSVHKLLESIPKGEYDERVVRELAAKLGIIDRRGIEGVIWFLGTELYGRMSKGTDLQRELPFSYAVDSEELFNTPSSDRVLLQGVIDACFIEDGEWVLIDYKTDNTMGIPPEEYAQRHTKQLELYAKALEKLSKRRVRESYLVLLRAKAAVRMGADEQW